MGQIKESDIKRDIVQFLKINGVLCWVNVSGGIYDSKIGGHRKQNGYGMRNGVSDILGIIKGKPLAIEVKTKTGKLSEHQQAFLDDFNKWGGIAFVARSVLEVQVELKGLL